MRQIPRIVIGGTQSGTGKTSVTLALVAALRRRGLRVQTFKAGPDFLDPTHLTLASGRPCYNLDGWMMGRKYVEHQFQHATADSDIAVIEGVMGLFDGADPATLEGSTAEIAGWLDAPVLLVANVHGMARSIAALVKGYAGFEARVRIAGVIANQCGSDRHAEWLAESLKAAALPPLVASIPRGAFPNLPSRHLGLVSAKKETLSDELLSQFADVFEKHAIIEEIVKLAQAASPLRKARGEDEPATTEVRVRLGVARDDAFHFYYQDNLDALARNGCEIVPFSPLRDPALPKGLNAVYVGGGYPEEHAREFAGNSGMLASVRDFAKRGHAVYAECGGLMYVSDGVESLDGHRFHFLGLLPAWTRMLHRRKALGYAETTLTRDALWGQSGAKVRGHEFHYSELLSDPCRKGHWHTAYAIERRRSQETVTEGFLSGRMLATYVHAHFASRPESIQTLVKNFGSTA
jgi:cobyrinic acid a,c-diamide synthase